MSPTQEGQALLRYCRTVKDLEGATLAKINGLGTRSEVRAILLGPTSMMRTRVVSRCIEVMERFPELTLTFEISDSKDGAEALRTGAVQLAVIPPEDVSREMDSKLLQPERYVLVGPKAWNARPLGDIVSRERIIDFDPSDLMTLSYLKRFKLISAARKERHFVNNNESLLEMISRKVGYGVLTQEFAQLHARQSNLCILNGGRYLENRLALAWYPRPQLADYFEAIVKAIR